VGVCKHTFRGPVHEKFSVWSSSWGVVVDYHVLVTYRYLRSPKCTYCVMCSLDWDSMKSTRSTRSKFEDVDLVDFILQRI
jgi:hypothetical protein